MFVIGIVASGLGILALRLTEPMQVPCTLQIHPAIDELTIHGLFDVTGHILTALILALTIRALGLPIPMLAVLFGGVAPDVGHIMIILDISNPIAGSSRNGTHSLVVVVILAAIGIVDRQHASVWSGIALGALSHLWRDMGTGTVPLAWPISNEVWSMPFARYLVDLLGMGLAVSISSSLRRVTGHQWKWRS